MYPNSYNYPELRSSIFQHFFIPVEESIVLEPEVFCPLEERCSDRCPEDIDVPAGFSPIYRNSPTPRECFTPEEARKIGIIIGIDWMKCPFDVEQFRNGLNLELEHGRKSPQTNITGDDPIMTGKIALVHLKEFPDYYIRLNKLEEEAKTYWENQS